VQVESWKLEVELSKGKFGSRVAVDICRLKFEYTTYEDFHHPQLRLLLLQETGKIED
jgi:hypothetical protein